MQSAKRTHNARAMSTSLRSALASSPQLQVHHLIPERSGGIFGHVSRPGSQDNMRISRFEFKTHFADQKYLHSLDGGECCQKRCLQIKSNHFIVTSPQHVCLGE